MTEENQNRSSHILSPRVERHVFSLVTCDKKFRRLSVTSNFFPRNFLSRAKFWESSKFYILENNSPYGNWSPQSIVSLVCLYIKSSNASCLYWFLMSLQHTSGSCSIIICIPMESCTTFHWEVIAHQGSCNTPGEMWLWYITFIPQKFLLIWGVKVLHITYVTCAVGICLICTHEP